MVPKQTKIVPKRIKFVRKNNIVIPILSAISDGGAETDKRSAETEKLVPKMPKLEVPKKVPKGVATEDYLLSKNRKMRNDVKTKFFCKVFYQKSRLNFI